MAQTKRHNSFIKQVMDQVKKDMEKDPKMKQDWEKAQKSAERIAQRQGKVEETFTEWGESLKSASSKTSELLSSWKEKAESASTAASSRISQATEEHESLKKAREQMGKGVESAASGSRVVFAKTKDVFTGVMDKSNQMFSMFSDEDKKAEKTKKWAEARAAWEAQEAEKAEQAEKASQMKAEGKEGVNGEGVNGEAGAKETAQKAEPESALVVSEARSSTWERFGAGLRDMPFLNSVFENPLLERVFGESEIAASIREMKEIDYYFRLEDFAEDVEYVVAPHIIKTFLEGDQEALQAHCGEAAFNAVNASIKTRVQQKLTLDPSILAGPKEVNLVSAKLNETGPPTFIWTFHMQQVNCLRDAAGDIIEGAVDDIRTVCYAMALNRHPNLEQKGLEYPWQISELAILWNQPCL